MGVTGLLPLLRPLTTESHIKGLRNKTVGVDAYCWLHKAVHCCATELCHGTPTDKWKTFVLGRIDMLLREGVYVYLVFDGARLPMKAEKEAERARNRAHHLNEGKQSLRLGDQKKAHSHFARACDVSPAMAAELIAFVRQYRSEVQVLVAPYEADAQLGYLCREGIVDVAMTEDSDLLLFGCQRVFFKLEKDGRGELIEMSNVFQCRNDELDMRECGPEDFLLTCVLSGSRNHSSDMLCAPHNGVGLKQARQTVREHKGHLDRILRALRLRYKEKFPKDYPDQLRQALATFYHQIVMLVAVYDPKSKQCTHMTSLPNNHNFGEDLSFLGTPFEPELACRIAQGLIDPISGMPFEGFEVTKKINKTIKSIPKRSTSATVLKPPRVTQQKTLSNFWGRNVEKTNRKPQKRSKSAPGQMQLGQYSVPSYPTSSPAHKCNSESYSSPIKLAELSPISFYAVGQMETPPSSSCHDENGSAEESRDDLTKTVKKCDFHCILNEESTVDKISEGAITSSLFGKSPEHLGSSKLMSKLKSSTRHHKTLGARSRPLHALSLPLHGGNQCDNNNQITAANKVLSATHHPHRLITVSFAETKASSYCGGGTPLTSSSPSLFEHFSFKRDGTAGHITSNSISSPLATSNSKNDSSTTDASHLEITPPHFSSKTVDQQPPGSGSHFTIESSTLQNVKKYSCSQQPAITPMMQNDAQSNLFAHFARGNAPGLVPSQ